MWIRLEVDAVKVGLKPGAIINGWAFTQHDGTAYWDKAGIVTRTPQSGQGFESLAGWAAQRTSLAKGTAPNPVRALKVEPEETQRCAEENHSRSFPGTRVCQDEARVRGVAQGVGRPEKPSARGGAGIPVTMVMADLPQPRDTFVLIRGQYDKRGEKVAPGVPSALPPLPSNATANRLGLARWLVEPGHPLTARVTVNRYWQHYFGRGIVKTAEDFGSRASGPRIRSCSTGSPSSSSRAAGTSSDMQKLMVMSATYQQASEVTPDVAPSRSRKRAAGPRPALSPRRRSGARFGTASAACSTSEVGGRSVKPYQPPGIWEAVAFGGSNTQNFKRDTGVGLYRRSLYTFWKRTAPPPSMMAFDAPSRETCVARRATDQHAAAGAGADERRAIRRGGSQSGRADDGGGADAGQRLSPRLPRVNVPDARPRPN